MNQSKTPWIRSKDLIDFLSGEFPENFAQGQERAVTGFQAGLIRVQARLARLQFEHDESKIHHWSVKEWVWGLRSGQLLLADDRFKAVIDEFAPPPAIQKEPFKGLWKLDLYELKFHRDELVRHFDVKVASSVTTAATMHTAGAETECKKWLVAAFAKDPHYQERKNYFKLEAREHCGSGLSGAGFERVWKEAVKNDPQRAASGRPPK